MRTPRLVLLAATLLFASVLLDTGLRSTARQSGSAGADTGDGATAWVCPMHPDYTADVDGTCPRCGMKLVHGAPFDVRDYALDFRTVPSVVKVGQKTTFFFNIYHPGTGQPITKFESVHERQYHLFVISQNMEYFAHIHPDEQPDGTWKIETALPKPGYYKVLSDFLPSGGSSQFLARPLVTAGYTGDLEGDSAHLVADTELTKTVDDLTATVSFDPPTVRRRAVRTHDVPSHRQCHASPRARLADLSRRVRAHAHHERGHVRVRARASARHSRDARR
jgi:hypothetical protein